MKKILRVFLCLLLVCLIFCTSDRFSIATSNTVRVAVLQQADHTIIAVDGRYRLIDFNTGRMIETGMRLRPTLVALEGGVIKIGKERYPYQRLVIEPRKDAQVSVNDRTFRGSMTIINNSGESLTVVNSIDLEEYIRGVLYHEISDKWPMEAIKAQAVATRTYALYSMEKFEGRDYDMTNDIYSQVYGGSSAERYRTNVAVRRTKGEVLTYKGKIFPAFFHANSGGITEDASELWDINLPPLRGNIQSPFSVNQRHYVWKLNARLQDIQEKLNKVGYRLGAIKKIIIQERNKSGRVRELKIVTRDGDEVLIDGKLFRETIGPNVLRSNKYDVDMKGWYVDFNGYGWGHGVGMCQWGAYGMAMLKYNYKQILEFYYPGAEITTIRDID